MCLPHPLEPKQRRKYIYEEPLTFTNDDESSLDIEIEDYLLLGEEISRTNLEDEELAPNNKKKEEIKDTYITTKNM
jgi:hypothetical protein